MIGTHLYHDIGCAEEVERCEKKVYKRVDAWRSSTTRSWSDSMGVSSIGKCYNC